MKEQIIVKKLNSSFVKLFTEADIAQELNSFFSVYADGYLFNPRYKLHIWDGKIRFFSTISNILPLGLLSNLEKFATEKDIDLIYEDFFDNSSFDFDESTFKSNFEKFITNPRYKIRDYQEEACKQALTKKVGILQCCTSSGKSMIIYNFLRNIIDATDNSKKMILIVPSVSLVEQIYTDFKDYGWNDIDDYVELMYSGKKPTFDMPVLITTWQSLQKFEDDKEFFEKLDVVVVDECHGAKAHVINKILKNCINTEYRIGTTGTLPDSTPDLLNINSVLGKTLYKITSKELIERGILTKMIVANIILKYPETFILKNKNREYTEEVSMVENYTNRNKALSTILDRTPLEHNSLLLCNHVEHVNETANWLAEKYPERKIKVITGRIKVKTREQIRVDIENEEGTIIVATYGTCSTGLNMPKLHNVILYSNSKSKIKVLQTLGRGLRKHNTKNVVILYDIVDDLSYKIRTGRMVRNYLYKHWQERLKYYNEQEFPIKTLELVI